MRRKREIISQGVTLEELKHHLRITTNIFDEDLDGKLRAAHNIAENYIGQVLMVSRFTDRMEFNGVVTLAAPLTSVTSVKVNGVDYPYTTSGNTLIIPGMMDGELEVVYESGDEQLADDVKIAILMIAADLFNNPSDHVQSLPRASENLLRPYRRYGR